MSFFRWLRRANQDEGTLTVVDSGFVIARSNQEIAEGLKMQAESIDNLRRDFQALPKLFERLDSVAIGLHVASEQMKDSSKAVLRTVKSMENKQVKRKGK